MKMAKWLDSQNSASAPSLPTHHAPALSAYEGARHTISYVLRALIDDTKRAHPVKPNHKHVRIVETTCGTHAEHSTIYNT